eukprot:Sspe_Gene.65743::Locus_38878_Transcript_1_1_Confidence_1.000_Length_2344::g.65743::m.65743
MSCTTPQCTQGRCRGRHGLTSRPTTSSPVPWPSQLVEVPIDKLYEKYLYNAYGMKNTTWGSPPYKNPQLAAGIRSTGDDYEKFLYGTLTNSFLPKNITDVLETDWTAPPVTPSGMFFGHYCMGNFFECYGYTIGLNASQPDVLPDRCKEEKIHSDPGLWGWFPIMDRSREYYYQVVIQENYVKAGIPEYLTMIAKPMINNIMKGRDPTKVNRQELLEGGGGLILRDIVGIDIASRVIPSGINVERPNLGLWLNLWEGLFSWHGQRFTSHFVFNVGNSSGTQFTSEKGFMTMHTRVKGASLSKWPAAVAIAGLVADKIMSFDDKASKYLSWWTKDPADPRSAITLRHLLSFTSGYEKDVDVKCASNPSANYLECAKELYEAIPAGKPANTTWTYLSCHLQFAGAMAVAASGLEIDQIFERYLYKKVGMTDTTWGDAPYKNPSMAGGIVTTGKDFERFLKGLLEYTVLPKEVCDEMEQDYSGHTQPSGDAWFGHYGMGHWFECIGYGTPGGPGAALPKRCKDEAIQAGPGLYGYYPLIDRKRGYYMQIVVQESLEKSGIPEYLRIVTKPVVDAIMEGKLVANVNRYDLLTAGGGILLRDLVYIQQSRDGEL